MNKIALTLTLILSFVFIKGIAQPQDNGRSQQPNDTEVIPMNSLKLEVNIMDSVQTSKINSFISSQIENRRFLVSVGSIVLGTLANKASSIIVKEIKSYFSNSDFLGGLLKTDSKKNKKDEWNSMIWKECIYEDSLTYIDNLSDFYSKGSFNGALDPENLQFNGFTVTSQKDGKDVLKFYCHMATDDESLFEIYNHSKFRLVLDSLYFFPYQCHLPNMQSNLIFPEKDKEYGRNTRFSFDDRDNLTVSLSFTITSSWYNEAIILAKDVELGAFSVQIPIDEESLSDSVFVYKKDMEGMAPLTIAGDCFIVPRSYMPLPGGKAHWGTGEYNVNFTITEKCDISPKMAKAWKKDYRRLIWMKKGKKVKDYFYSIYKQNGNSIIRSLIEKTSQHQFKQLLDD
jgi:hypothetical protein